MINNMKYNYYVIQMRRVNDSHNYVGILDFDEAVNGKWIDSAGKRIWNRFEDHTDSFNPARAHGAHTFVYGFNSLDDAINFYDSLEAALVI